jgi:hypothetical protein
VTLAAAVKLLYLAAFLAALAVGYRNRRHRPVAVYLGAVLAIDMIRAAAEACLLPPPPRPYQGWLLLLRHLDQGAYFALLLAGPALALAVFTGLKSRWPIAVTWAALWLVGWLGYPELRGGALLKLYSAVEAAGGLLAVVLFVRWALRHPELLAIKGVPPAVAVSVVLLGASLVASVLPSLAGAQTLARWPAIVGLHGVALAAVLVLQLRALIGNDSKQETS